MDNETTTVVRSSAELDIDDPRIEWPVKFVEEQEGENERCRGDFKPHGIASRLAWKDGKYMVTLRTAPAQPERPDEIRVGDRFKAKLGGYVYEVVSVRSDGGGTIHEVTKGQVSPTWEVSSLSEEFPSRSYERLPREPERPAPERKPVPGWSRRSANGFDASNYRCRANVHEGTRVPVLIREGCSDDAASRCAECAEREGLWEDATKQAAPARKLADGWVRFDVPGKATFKWFANPDDIFECDRCDDADGDLEPPAIYGNQTCGIGACAAHAAEMGVFGGRGCSVNCSGACGKCVPRGNSADYDATEPKRAEAAEKPRREPRKLPVEGRSLSSKDAAAFAAWCAAQAPTKQTGTRIDSERPPARAAMVSRYSESNDVDLDIKNSWDR